MKDFEKEIIKEDLGGVLLDGEAEWFQNERLDTKITLNGSLAIDGERLDEFIKNLKKLLKKHRI